MRVCELKLAWVTRVSVGLLTIAIIVIPITLPAQVKWTGDIDDDWFKSGNWHTGDLPDADDIVHIDTTAPKSAAVRQAGAQTEQLHVGFEQTGELVIEGGGKVITNGSGRIGSHPASEGLVIVSDPSSRWEIEGSLHVGDKGAGTLMIVNGGTVIDGFFSQVGSEVGAEGSVTVTGSGALWESGDITVGFNGNGVLTIENGGTVAGGRSIGLLETGQGTVSVSGEGSEWVLPNRLNVGMQGNGQLIVFDGGVVSCGSLAVVGGDVGSGSFASGEGEVVVTGAGSELNVGEGLFLGGPGGTGELTVADGGSVNAVEVIFSGSFADAAGGALNIGAAHGEEPATPGFVNVGSIDITRQDATLNFNHTSSTYELAADVSGEGVIDHLSGITVLSGDGSAFAGETRVIGGSLSVQHSLGGTINVLAEGTLIAAGTIGDTNISGTLAGEEATDVLEVAGDLVLGSGSIWRAASDLLGAGQLIEVDGDLVLDGMVHLFNSEGLEEGTYTLITYSGSLTDNGVAIAGAPVGLGARIDSSIAGEVRVEVFPDEIFNDRFEQ